MYRASDQVDNEEYIEELQTAADRLGLDTDARSRATDVFLSNLPESSRSKRATLASSLYVGALVAGDQRSQTEVAEAVGVSRLSVQQNWKELLESVGLDAPDW
jgi:transcription initiation factor TFIIIB Brf1 subunit/transcription initiation factor TFIIB